ncbi:MAG: PAS domain S-box protein, partial [Anaerolineae bacterium]
MTQQTSLRTLQQELEEKNHLLELVNAELSREIAERKRAQEAEQALLQKLGERVKELVAAHERLDRQNKEILKQKDLLDGLLQHSPLAVVINDLDQRIVVANPAFQTLFGYSQEETIGANLDDLLSTQEKVQETRELTKVTLVGPTTNEAKRKRKDGTLADVEIFSVPFFVGGEQFGYLAFYHDISDRRDVEADLEKTQRTYTAILDTLEDPYFEADPRGILTYVNLAFCQSVGYQREEVIGQHFRHFVDNRTFREVLELFGKLYETKQPIKGYEGHYRRKDGEVLVAEWSVSPILRGGEVVGSRGLIRDITSRVRAEAALRVARDEAEARASDLA